MINYTTLWVSISSNSLQAIRKGKEPMSEIWCFDNNEKPLCCEVLWNSLYANTAIPERTIPEMYFLYYLTQILLCEIKQISNDLLCSWTFLECLCLGFCKIIICMTQSKQTNKQWNLDSNFQLMLYKRLTLYTLLNWST